MFYVKFVPMYGGTPAQVIVNGDEYDAQDAVEGLVRAACPGSDPVVAYGDNVYDGRCYCGACDGYGKRLGTIFIIPAKAGEVIFG